MVTHRLHVVVTAVCLVLLSTSRALAQTTHYVDNMRDCAELEPCYTTIMAAVDAAMPSDIIKVFPGVYHESVFIGAGKDNLVLTAFTRSIRPVIAVPAGASYPQSIGVSLESSSGVQVRHFIILAPEAYGVLTADARGSMGAVIQGSLIKSLRGIWGRQSLTIKDNVVLGGMIYLFNSSASVVEGNTVKGGGLNGVAIQVGVSDLAINDNVVRGNLVRGGDILLPYGNSLLGNTVESNLVENGNIRLSGVRNASGNVVRRNVVRRGGIELGMATGHVLGTNTIEDNVVSGSSGDGIALRASGGSSLVTNNTSLGNAGCDIKDDAVPGMPQNTWTQNRFRTKCGAAAD